MPDLGTPILGHHSKLYLGILDDAGDWTTPVLDEVETLIDSDRAETADGKEIMIRGADYVGEELGKSKQTLELKFAAFSADDDRDFLLTRQRAKAPVIVCDATGDITEDGIERALAAWIVKEVKWPKSKDDPDEVTFTLGLFRPWQYEPIYDVTS